MTQVGFGGFYRAGEQIGEPVNKHTPWRHRYTQAPIAITNGSERVRRLIYDGKMIDPTEAQGSISSGRMPRRGGIFRAGEGTYISCDLMAARLLPHIIELDPALKSAVDPDSKIPRSCGLIAMTQFMLAEGCDMKVARPLGIMPIAESFNPDNEPWKADYYSQQGQRIVQNEHGIAVARLDVLRLGGIDRLPITFDPQRGSTVIYLR